MASYGYNQKSTDSRHILIDVNVSAADFTIKITVKIKCQTINVKKLRFYVTEVWTVSSHNK